MSSTAGAPRASTAAELEPLRTKSVWIIVLGVVYLVDLALGLPLAWSYRVPLGAPSRGSWGAVVAAGVFETAGFACIALEPIAQRMGGQQAPTTRL